MSMASILSGRACRCTMHCHQLPCASNVLACPAVACIRPLARHPVHCHRATSQYRLHKQGLSSCAVLQNSLRLPSVVGKQRQSNRGSLVVTNSYSKPDVADRVVASVPYLIPLIDGLKYGRFFFLQFPQFARLLAPLNPLVSLYFGVPFASFAVFFAVYLGIINNQNFSRYCRFNAMQAVILDILLILPGLFENLFRPPSGGPGLQVYISVYNTIWLFVFVCVAYGVGSCLTGQTPRLPFVANAADQQIR